MTKQKGLAPIWIILIIIAGILVLGIAGSIFYLWWSAKEEAVSGAGQQGPALSATKPGEDETASWQILENSTYGYYFKYPDNWYVHEKGFAPPPPRTTMVASVPQDSDEINYTSFWVSVDDAQDKTLDNYDEIVNLVQKGDKKSNFEIDSERAVKLEHRNGLGWSVYILKDKSIYRLDAGCGTKALYETDKKTLELITESFKFGVAAAQEAQSNASISPQETSAIKTGPLSYNEDEVQKAQASVDDGSQSWRLDPLAVVLADGIQLGFAPTDKYELLSKEYAEAAGTYVAEVQVTHDNAKYIVQLIQPAKQGEAGIWTINSIRLAAD